MCTSFSCLSPRFSAFGAVVCGTVLFLTVPGRAAQNSPSAPDPHQAELDEAIDSFRAKHYDIALMGFKKLMGEEPENLVYKKFASETALNLGDADFVVQTLQPVEAAHPDDWQAHLLLARAYAQMVEDPQHAKKRDEEIVLVTRQHNQDPNSQLGKMRDFLLETVHQGDKTIQFYPAFTPWGPYHVHLIARTFDAAGSPAFALRWRAMTSISRSLPGITQRKLQPGSVGTALTATPQIKRVPTARPFRLITPTAFSPGSPAMTWCANAFSPSLPGRPNR